MKKQQNNADWRHLWNLHLRAIKDINHYAPGTFLSLLLEAIVRGSIPYATIWFSAQIINELAGSRRPHLIWKWVVLTLCVNLFLGLLAAVLLRWKNANLSCYNPRKDLLFTNKNFNMDFANLDNLENRDRLSQIKQSENWSGWGLNRVTSCIEALSQAAVGLIGALLLSVGAFTNQVPTGNLVILNGLLFPLLMLLLVALIAAFESYWVFAIMNRWADNAEQATQANRLFTSFTKYYNDMKLGMDTRVYPQQHRVLMKQIVTTNAFRKGAYFDKVSRGPLGIMEAVSGGSTAIITGSAYVFVCLKALGGAFGIGSVTQYVSAIAAMSRHVSDTLSILSNLRANIPFLEKTYEYLDIPNEMYQGSLTTEKRSDRQYDVEFRDVSFRYPGNERESLSHVSVKFQVGQRLAVVGMNGSGKTTFIKLLCRLYDPTEGQILLNGIDIRKYRYDDYMDIFSVVFQDYQLLPLPLGENVAGKKQYDRERAHRALKDAGFAERLASLPKGLDTILYKDLYADGIEISGGEAQKIAIARALYKDSPFIILDEPTAALDPIAEAEIYSKFNDIVGNKTAIYISHRLSSCRFCDNILVFDHGSVVQQGNHDSLLAEEGGKYHELWHAQAQYYEEAKEDSVS